MEFPAERDRDERMRTGDGDMEAATKRNTQQAADPQRAERANKPKWSSDHMSRFLSAQRGSVIKSSPRFIKLALLAELHNQQLLFQNNL